MTRHLALAALLLPSVTLAQDPVEISIDTARPGKALPPAFLGISCEIHQLLPNPDGSHYFSPDNKPLLAQFRSLGIRHLRIGGSTTDFANEPFPTLQDIDALFTFARAANVKVLYTLRLKDADIRANAAAAAHIQKNYPDIIEAFVIGNEPSSIGFTYDAYRDAWQRIADAVTKEAPEAAFAGPGINPNLTWNKGFIREFSPTYRIAALTNHSYPAGCSYKNPSKNVHFPSPEYDRLIPQDAAPSRDKLLNPAMYAEYTKILDTTITPALEGTTIPYRLEETNSFWFGGLKNVSNTYAATLWGIDYLAWWAAHDAAGINFHTGDMVAGPIPCYYAVFQSSPEAGGGYVTRPVGYAMKTFSLAAQGRRLPLTVARAENLNLSASAFLADDRTLRVLLVNKDHGPNAPTLQVRLNTPVTLNAAQSLALTAPNGDISTTTGITLGNAPIGRNGDWTPTFTPASPAALTLPPASALVVEAKLAP
jgi:hypothetical protein